jgi:hypothetical protein
MDEETPRKHSLERKTKCSDLHPFLSALLSQQKLSEFNQTLKFPSMFLQSMKAISKLMLQRHFLRLSEKL